MHQIFQLALAAEEMGELRRLYCSMAAGVGLWGRLLAKVSSSGLLRPMGLAALPVGKLREIPLPMLARQVHQRFAGAGQRDYFLSSSWFGAAAARRLRGEVGARVFVGVETCALEGLRVAGEMGMTRVLDCPGIPAPFLAREIALAADDLGVDCPSPATSQRMHERKQEELAAADVVLVCSEMQRRYYCEELGMAAERLRVNPLWVDRLFTSGMGMVTRRPRARGARLRVLCVGHATVGKGAPYALQAMERLGDTAELTLVGGVDETTRRWAGDRLARHRVIEWMPRAELLRVYPEYDVLLFPTLGDSFGFVGMEAMACGLPVVTTVNAGMPVPDESWRVPARDAEGLALRLQAYADDEALLEADSLRARAFVQDFTPEQYRERARAVFAGL